MPQQHGRGARAKSKRVEKLEMNMNKQYTTFLFGCVLGCISARSAVRGRGSRYSQSSPLGGSRAVVPPHQQYRTTYSSWLYRPGHPSPQRYYRVDVRAYGAYPLSRSSASWYYPFCTLIRRLTTPSHEHRLNKITCSIVPRLLLVVETAMRRTQQRCGAHM